MSGEHKPKKVYTLLCVDDDELITEAISDYLIRQGYETLTASPPLSLTVKRAYSFSSLICSQLNRSSLRPK